MGAAVEVRGVRELRSAMRRMDNEMPGKLKQGMMEIATVVVAGIQSKAPRRSGDAADSVRPRASQTGAAIAFGGQAAPYFPWLDFGGTTGKGHRPGVAWSGSIKREWLGNPKGMGRFVYPTIEEKGPEIEKRIEGIVARTATRADLEVR